MIKEIILKNKRSEKAAVIGNGRLKLNLSIGVSPSKANFEEELEKVRIGEKNGIDFITDNSIGILDTGTRDFQYIEIK